MSSMKKQSPREIIEDFAKEIQQAKRTGPKPSKEVIYFRAEREKNIERDVYEVPNELLRFRKDNGRIASDVFSYEKFYGPLIEKDEKAQKIIKKYLREKDPEKTNELKNSIKHSGQREPAIITADGFLINGNRRKLALEELWEEKKEDKFLWMKVVILPGNNFDGEGGPPTLKEIEEIENRYQLQSEGKSDYYNFDRALSMRRKIEHGMTLEEQLKDDPNYANLSNKELKKQAEKFKEEYIKPLECIDRYLEHLGREGLYFTISKGISDKSGKWQAFRDYYNNVRKSLEDDYKRTKLGIEEEEIGDVEDAAFKIIRKREFKDLPKAHKIVRDLPKWLKHEEAKKELFKINEIEHSLDTKECYDEDGNEHDERKKDEIWSEKNSTLLHKHVNEAYKIVQHEKERETPLSLLEASLKKLEHENMEPNVVKKEDLETAMKLANEVKQAADNLESEFFNLKKKR